MIRMFLMTVVAVLACSCEYVEEVDGVSEKPSKRVRFSVSDGDGWSVTRSLEADGVGMTDLWLFDYVDGELVRTLHQSGEDADFGEPVLQMGYGRHTVYFVASRGKSPSVDGTQVTWSQPSDTFWKSVSVTVGDGSRRSVSVTLDRVVTKLRVLINDAIPDGAATLVMKPASWWYGLDYVTGAAVSSSDAERSVSLPASSVGTEGLGVSFFGLSDDEEWLTDLSVTVNDNNGGVLGTVSLADVPFERNRVTTVSGSLFSAGGTFSVSLNETWKEGVDYEW